MIRTLLPMLLMSVPILAAQQPGSVSGDDHELIRQLLRRVNELELEVQQLKSSASAGRTPAAPIQPPAVPQEQPPVPAAPAPATAAQAAQMGQDTMRDMAMPGTQGMQFRGFSDIRYVASDQKGVPNTFALGQFNLFITSKLSDKFNALAEVVVEADSTNAVGIDLERLLFQYAANDHFNVSAGRYHTAIGFYNTAYHHSTWLQTTVDRPFLFAFEDGGGILPIHNVGLTSTGLIPSGNLGLHYVAEVGNGRASRSPLDEAVQNVQDENNGKSYNLALYARPEALRGFQTGFSVYRDVLHPGGLGSIGQTIYSGHAIYQSPRFEFLNELVVVRHAPEGSEVLRIPAFYSQISRAFGKVRPYFRYEYMNVPRRDPLFGDVGLLHGPLTGIRWDFTEFAAFKLEYNRTMRRDLPSINGLRTQVSFTF